MIHSNTAKNCAPVCQSIRRRREIFNSTVNQIVGEYYAPSISSQLLINGRYSYIAYILCFLESVRRLVYYSALSQFGKWRENYVGIDERFKGRYEIYSNTKALNKQLSRANIVKQLFPFSITSEPARNE